MSEEQQLLFDVIPRVFARRLLQGIPPETREAVVALLAEMARQGLGSRSTETESRERTDED